MPMRFLSSMRFCRRLSHQVLSPTTVAGMRGLVYFSLLVFALAWPRAADASVWLTFRLGEQSVGALDDRAVAGIEGSLQFRTPVVLDAGFDYLAAGQRTDLAAAYRGNLGVSYPLRFFCLLPFRIAPGMGFSHTIAEKADDPAGPGFHLRLRGTVDILRGVSAGLEIRRDWFVEDGGLREGAFVFQYAF
jgi:hypothetical protein